MPIDEQKIKDFLSCLTYGQQGEFLSCLRATDDHLMDIKTIKYMESYWKVVTERFTYKLDDTGPTECKISCNKCSKGE